MTDVAVQKIIKSNFKKGSWEFRFGKSMGTMTSLTSYSLLFLSRDAFPRAADWTMFISSKFVCLVKNNNT